MLKCLLVSSNMNSGLKELLDNNNNSSARAQPSIDYNQECTNAIRNCARLKYYKRLLRNS